MVGEYFDPHYPARIEGQRQGQIEGFAAGHQTGYDAGHADGHTSGWNACLEIANTEMREHVKRNEALAKLTSEQHALILQLSDERQASAAEYARVLAELKAYEQRVHALGSDYAFRYQKVLLCMLVLQETIATLACNDPEKVMVRSTFARHYEDRMRAATRRGMIQRPVDQDEAFAKALPETHRFLVHMLRLGEPIPPSA